MSENQGEVYFALMGDDVDPDLITRKLGITPSEISRKGVPIPKFDSWRLSTGKLSAGCVDVYAMAEQIVAVLLPKAEEIQDLIRKYNLTAYLNVVLIFANDEHTSTPAIGFSRDIIQFLAKVDAAIDVDTYVG